MTTSSHPETDKAAPARTPPAAPVTPDLPAEVRVAHAPAHAEPRPAGRAIHVAPDIVRRVTQPDEVDREKRDLDALVHKVLVIGLALSTALMLAGVALDLILGRAMPETVAALGEVFPRIMALRPSGLLTLGLLVLIATPILRVIGSIVAFVYERDWRYAGITSVVFLVMMVSIMIGKG
ncbi:DUF1634 domain-containing protein [Oscillochloris sp. ZM17-4]|uniref:DUF1634 domain-containing protein n=1 Tax=Oscillochloris sp. ZM17-4 TaxID=2866714 RepID=UPI001C72C560|nr:DUF1634 domain-containing protein [Oscillochloris sp. ZM17-4]MBX0327725.1 DUF1634 domain-containing protein [Oscillochloris sp. ZM17-4]